MAKADMLNQNSDLARASESEAQGTNLLESDVFGSEHTINTNTVEQTEIANDDQQHDSFLTTDNVRNKAFINEKYISLNFQLEFK